MWFSLIVPAAHSLPAFIPEILYLLYLRGREFIQSEYSTRMFLVSIEQNLHRKKGFVIYVCCTDVAALLVLDRFRQLLDAWTPDLQFPLSNPFLCIKCCILAPTIPRRIEISISTFIVKNDSLLVCMLYFSLTIGLTKASSLRTYKQTALKL